MRNLGVVVLALGLAACARGPEMVPQSLDVVLAKPPLDQSEVRHFVMDNGVYAVTGGQPVPNAGRFSFTGLARAAGYAAAFEFDDLEELTTRIDEVFDTKGPVFVTIKSIPEIEGEADAEEMHPELRPRGLPVAMHELHQTLNG